MALQSVFAKLVSCVITIWCVRTIFEHGLLYWKWTLVMLFARFDNINMLRHFAILQFI